ncbi:MAG: hypothetical protein LUH23_04000 [Oscillospiraceae bacterium]|nr:hypothetical protein [Oscillospiraceae bacterium]
MSNVKSVFKYILGAVVSSLIGFAVGKVLEFESVLDMVLVVVSFCLLCLLIICISDMVMRQKKHDEEKVKLDEQISECNKKIAGSDGSDSENYYLLSLTQVWSLKIKYLEKSAELGNLMAALTLASCYDCGVVDEGTVVLEKDYDKAAYWYNKFITVDYTGICAWMLGWYYEKQKITATKSMSEADCLKEARKYYEMSCEKGFSKAFNSMGKFTYYGWARLEKSHDVARDYYRKASEKGDFYASNNRGLASMKAYLKSKDEVDLNDAEKSFRMAAEFDSEEAYFQLGQICEIKADNNPNSPYIDEAKNYYIKAFSKANNKYSASALYMLGKLIKANPCLATDSAVKAAIVNPRLDDLSFECMMRAYETFEAVGSNKIFGVYAGYYQELKSKLEMCLK